MLYNQPYGLRPPRLCHSACILWLTACASAVVAPARPRGHVTAPTNRLSN